MGDESAAAETVEKQTWHPIAAAETGYLQSIDSEALWSFAEREKTVLRLDCEVGDFVMEGRPIFSSTREVDDEAAKDLGALFAIGNFRTVDQDAGFGIRQIVDIALKALSPGVNDTTTAVSCLDYLSAILVRLAQRRIASPYRKDNGHLRIIAPAPSFAEFVARALDEIRLCAANNVTIFLRMIGLLTRVAQATDDARRKLVLLEHARVITELADVSIPAPYDRARFNRELDALRTALGAGEKVAALSMSRGAKN